MRKNKLAFLLAALLSVGAFTSCSKGPGVESNPFHESETETGSSESSEEIVDVDEEAAQVVIDMIDALDENKPYEELKEDVEAVLEAYNDLTARQKSMVTNYDKLVAILDVIETKELIVDIINIIDSLDVDNPDADLVTEAREKYNELLGKGQEWADQIPNEKLEKLKACELAILSKVANPLLETLTALDPEESQDGARFKLLSRKLDDFLKVYTNEDIATLELYDEYLGIKEVVERVYTITNDYYINTTHNLPEELAGANLAEVEDDEFASVFTQDFTGLNIKGPQNIQFATQADFTSYKKIGFFVSWPLSGNKIQFIQERDGLTKTIFEGPETVANTYQYIEVDTATMLDPEGLAASHIGAYFEDRSVAMVDGYKISAIVGVGIDPVKAQAAVDAVDAMIEALDIENLVAEEVEAARQAYDELALIYSAEWQAKVKAENVQKLIACEEKLVEMRYLDVNAYIEKLESIELISNQDYALFVSIAEAIDELYATFTQDMKDKVTEYDNYLALKETVGKKVEALDNESYAYVNGAITPKFAKQYDDDLGLTHNVSWPNGKEGSIQLFLEDDLVGDDWTTYKSVGFFVRYNSRINDRIYLIPDGDWARWLFQDPVLVDEETNLYWYEFDTSKLAGAFTSPTYFQAYFGANITITKMEITPIVGFKYDTSNIDALITKALTMPTSTNAEKTKFVLLTERIDALLSKLNSVALAKVANYDEYVAKRNEVQNMLVLYNSYFSVYDPASDNVWPELTLTESDEYGYFHSHTYATTQTGGARSIFINNAKGANWTAYNKIAFFAQFDKDINDNAYFIMTEGWGVTSYCVPQLIDAVNNIYYYEFDITNAPQAMIGNPEICLYIGGGITNITIGITNIVGFKK